MSSLANLSRLIPKLKCCQPDETPLPESKTKSNTLSTKFKTVQVISSLLLLPSLLLAPTLTMALLLLLFGLSVLSLTMTTTPALSTYLPSFIVDIPDIQEFTLELTPTTIKQKPEFMQIKDPRTTNGYKVPPLRCCYRMLWAIHHRKRAVHTVNLKTTTDLLQY